MESNRQAPEEECAVRVWGSTLSSAAIVLSLLSPASESSQPQTATVCKVLVDPAKYDRKIIRLKARVTFDWEFIEAWYESCKEGILLVYPDEIQPRPSFSLVRDEQYERYRQFLEAREYPRKAGSSTSIDTREDFTESLPLYEVEAVLTGRLDSADVRDNKGRMVHKAQFGHLNSYRARLVLQSLSDVKAIPRNPKNVAPQVQR
jgi:hypothetical protein